MEYTWEQVKALVQSYGIFETVVTTNRKVSSFTATLIGEKINITPTNLPNSVRETVNRTFGEDEFRRVAIHFEEWIDSSGANRTEIGDGNHNTSYIFGIYSKLINNN